MDPYILARTRYAKPQEIIWIGKVFRTSPAQQRQDMGNPVAVDRPLVNCRPTANELRNVFLYVFARAQNSRAAAIGGLCVRGSRSMFRR